MEIRFARLATGGVTGYHTSALLGEVAVEHYQKSFTGQKQIAYSPSGDEITVHIGQYDIYWVLPLWVGVLTTDRK